MRKRRVGTISMGIVLIAFGVLIFIAQIESVSAVKLSIKFWPAILFLIGGEILWYSYKYKEEDMNIKYDFFSIFIVLFIVVINLGIYSLIETNMIDKINTRIFSQVYKFKIPCNEFEVDKEIEKIVVNSPFHTSLTIRSGKSNKVVSSGSINITTDDREKAKEVLNDEYVVINKLDNVLYISFMDCSDYNNNIQYVCPCDFNITLPCNKKVEINGGSDLRLMADEIKDNWIIDSVNRAKIRLGKNIDVKVDAYVDAKEMLKGNVKWKTTEEKIQGEEEHAVKGELVYGNGDSCIYVLNCDELTVDKLE